MAKPKSLREQVAGFLFGPERDRLGKLTEMVIDAYRARPVSFAGQLNPADLIDQIRESVDSRMVDLLIRQLQYSEGIYNSTNETMRISIVRESRSLYAFDPITQFIIELWTDYGFSSKPDITPEDESAADTWREFWDAETNQFVFAENEIQNLSNTPTTVSKSSLTTTTSPS